MFGSMLGKMGGMLGGFAGGGILSSAGRFLGKWIGDELDSGQNDQVEYYKIGRVKNDLYPISLASGQVIPLIFGKARVNGQLIWATTIKEVPSESSIVKNFTSKTAIYHKVDFLYYCSFALGICEGEIQNIERIWCNDEITTIEDYKHRIYLGTKDQLPDPLIASLSENDCPAFRDLAYIVFEDFPLAEFGNNIPKFSFELLRKPNISLREQSLENKIRGINIIPGSGEYVYDTIIQKKTLFNGVSWEDDSIIKIEDINCHNRKKIANAIYSLDYLKQICPKIEWAAPVVSWFGNSLDIGICNIYPAVEYKDDPNVRFSEEWRVGNYTRYNAAEISKDITGSPNYGGSVNDASLVRYLVELKARGLKIMLYPMIFLDIPGKPWRGHMTGTPNQIENFFRKRGGYNEFILHYANLTRGLVDAFIIGSELKKITSIKEGNRFPAVTELARLAEQVKAILGQNTKITYAADWSEYHHTEGGWYHLDELWASSSIDFIGIDNYMPLTMRENGSPTLDEIRAGTYSGEGYDYYFENGVQIPLPPAYAWKNLKYWWENEHINPLGQRTAWRPRSKKIWFTEYGFPSIDKATNQPNVFYDPNCVDGGAPYFSNESTDFMIQRSGINAFIDFWQNEEYIENMFLWCFDARPYPAWPHSKFWGDWHLWEKGHWINGKIGHILISDIICEVSSRCAVPLASLEFQGLDECVSGINLSKLATGFEFISLLRSLYFFDIKDNPDGGLAFVRRQSSSARKIDGKDLLKISDDKILEEQHISDSTKTSSIVLKYQNQNAEYATGCERIALDNRPRNQKYISLAFVMSDQEARTLTNQVLSQINSSNSIILFKLPFIYMDILPSDILTFSYNNKHFDIRVVSVLKENLSLMIMGSSEEDIELPSPPVHIGITYVDEFSTGRITQVFPLNIDIFYPSGSRSSNKLYFVNSSSNTRALRVGKDENFLEKISDIKGGTIECRFLHSNLDNMNPYLINEDSYIDVDGENIKARVNNLQNFSSAMLYSNQVIFVGKISHIGQNRYRLSHLIFPIQNNNIERAEIGSKIYSLDKLLKIEKPLEINEKMIYMASKDEFVEILF